VSLVVVTWNHLQADSDYAGKTYLFVTSDHGRHDDAHGGYQHHGDECDGCRHITFLALGPDIRAGHEVTTLYGQEDLCSTVGTIMGMPTPLSQGKIMRELFE
jgi:arylsulfatase A-like enzyme